MGGTEFRKALEPNRKLLHKVRQLSDHLRLDERCEVGRVPGESWRLLSCAVNLSIVDDDGDTHAVVRYDNAHGRPHRDELFRSPPAKVWIDVEPLERFREWALGDLFAHIDEYVQLYGESHGSPWKGASDGSA